MMQLKINTKSRAHFLRVGRPQFDGRILQSAHLLEEFVVAVGTEKITKMCAKRPLNAESVILTRMRPRSQLMSISEENSNFFKRTVRGGNVAGKLERSFNKKWSIKRHSTTIYRSTQNYQTSRFFIKTCPQEVLMLREIWEVKATWLEVVVA